MTDTTVQTPPTAPEDKPIWPIAMWWKLMDIRIGIIPLPVFVLIAVLTWAFVQSKEVPKDILMNMAVLAAGGFACAEIGKRIPFLNQIGLAAIFATFIPSYLVFAHLIPDPLKDSIVSFTKSSNFLYLFISAIIVGSILGMDRRVLIQGFLKIFIPLALGTVVAGLVGTGVGMALGLGAQHTIFKIVVPIMAGGVGEGAIPLSTGYALFSHHPQGEIFAEILPSVMLGSLTAILFAGILNLVGKRLPHLTGEGRLQIDEHDDFDFSKASTPVRALVDPATVGGAAVLTVTLFLVGALAQKLLNWPGPVTMLFIAVLLKLGRFIPPTLENGAYSVYRFFTTCVTYPLLFAIGVALTPWDKLIQAFNAPTIITIVATVTAMMGTGFFVARFLKMYPIDVAIVNACHSGQGGTGDVAILSAANRMQLMPFAQIATRIGGALTVVAALAAFAKYGVS